MKRTITRIINVTLIVLFCTGLFSRPAPVSAGVSEWTPETIPSLTNSILGPAGLDIRDYAICNDNLTIYAVPGDSIAANTTYKSLDGGNTWAALNNVTVDNNPFRADLVAVAPDDNNIVVIANNSTPGVYLSADGGSTWTALPAPQAAAPGAPAAVISDISVSPDRSGIHYIAAAGWEAGNIANLWYFPYGLAFPAWQDTNTLPGFSSANETAAIAFSPGFAADATVVAVTGNYTSGVSLQMLDMASLRWNDSSVYTDYPCSAVNATITHIDSASLALSPTFDGLDDSYRTLFIGLTLSNNGALSSSSGIYRFKDTTEASILTNKQIHSLDLNGTYLIAGLWDNTTVYRVLNPMATTSWTLYTSTVTKNPGGENRVLVSWLGTSVLTATGGVESGFSISKDSGTTFNDISLIDTKIANAQDVAMSANAGKVYLVTDNGTNTSVWYKTTGAWTRVFSKPGATDFIIRVERSSASIVYLAQKGTANIYYNATSGAGQWQARLCNLLIRDITVESSTALYALDNTGKVSKSANAGTLWSAPADTSLASGSMISLISAGKLLAGSRDGYVAYSFDSGATWTKIPEVFGAGATDMQIVTDAGFATNKIIYAATAASGQDIKRWQIGTSTTWTGIFPGIVPGGIFGLAIDTNTLYAMEWDPIANQSGIWRFIAPVNATSISAGWTEITAAASIRFNNGPQALKTSTNKLWSIDTNPAGTGKLYSLTDSITDVTISLESPVNNYLNRINSITGVVYDLAFSWKRSGAATAYEIRISMDPDFVYNINTVSVNSTDELVSAIIGPGQPGDRNINFWPATTYYWKIRTTKPGYSLFSSVRQFSIDVLPQTLQTSLQLISPGSGSTITDNTPAFSWNPLQDATEYEFILSESINMTALLLDAKVASTAIQVQRNLEPGKTYFWQVRSTKPILGEWSPLGVFTLAALASTPTPAVTETSTVTTTIVLPSTTQSSIVIPLPEDNPTVTEIVPLYLIIAIFIGVVLTALVLYLAIFITGKAPSQVYSGEGPVRRRRDTVKRPVQPDDKPVIPAITERPHATVTGGGEIPPMLRGISKPQAEQPPVIPEKNKEAASVIFAAKSLMWMAGAEKGTAEAITDKEKADLGKKLAARIQALAKKENLYLKYPEDAALLLQIWAQYGSKKETSRYLADSLKNQPENAIRLIRSFLPRGTSPESAEAADKFSLNGYKALTEVIDPDKVYEALTKISKFKEAGGKEAPRINPADSNLISGFMRLHLQNKNNR